MIKHGFIIYSDYLLFITATLLILSDNVSGEIGSNFLFSKKSKQNKILDTFFGLRLPDYVGKMSIDDYAKDGGPEVV